MTQTGSARCDGDTLDLASSDGWTSTKVASTTEFKDESEFTR